MEGIMKRRDLLKGLLLTPLALLGIKPAKAERPVMMLVYDYHCRRCNHNFRITRPNGKRTPVEFKSLDPGATRDDIDQHIHVCTRLAI